MEKPGEWGCVHVEQWATRGEQNTAMGVGSGGWKERMDWRHQVRLNGGRKWLPAGK